MYVEAAEVEEHLTGRGPGPAGTTYEGEPVTREYGKMGKSLKNAIDARRHVREYGADTCACTR
jgi:leucyl-tRNA synthetase